MSRAPQHNSIPGFTCSNCGAAFTLRSAACDDWNDPERNFGCPTCRTFFLRVQRPRHWLEHLAQAHYLLAAVVVAVYMFEHPYMGLHWLVLPAWLALAVWFAFALDRLLPPRTRLVPIPHVETVHE